MVQMDTVDQAAGWRFAVSARRLGATLSQVFLVYEDDMSRAEELLTRRTGLLPEDYEITAHRANLHEFNAYGMSPGELMQVS